MMEFLAPPITIDFYASHEMQKQCGMSLFRNLANHHTCVWRGERDAPTPGASAAVVLGHVSDFPQARKSKGNYSYAFFLSHDLGEKSALYRDFYMKQFDIIFVPGKTYAESAAKYLDPDQRIVVIGWPKYDIAADDPNILAVADSLESLKKDKTIIYGPSYAHHGAWRKAFQVFENLDATIIVKNHVYFSERQITEYVERNGTLPAEIIACDEMEAAARASSRGRFIVMPRALNICALFPHASWLLSDSSSCLVEFAPFGQSIETYANGEISREFPEVLTMSVEAFAELYSTGANRSNTPEASIFRHPEASAGEIGARQIDAFLYSVSPEAARRAADNRLGKTMRLELRLGETFNFRLLLAKRAMKNPRLLARWISNRRKGIHKGPTKVVKE